MPPDDTRHTLATMTDSEREPVQLAMIDGRDALLMVLVRPGRDADHIAVEAHAAGLGKRQGAKVLMRVAASWLAEADAADAAQ